MTHARLNITGGYIDGEFTIDGERFPYPVHSISYRFDNNNQLPTLIVEFDVDHLTIDHTWPPRRTQGVDTEAEAPA